MTAPTPEQMRELADAADNPTRDNDWDNRVIADVMAALRAAADQLEAVQDRERLAAVIYDAQHSRNGARWLSTVDGTPNVVSYVAADAIRAILTTVTAPQEDRDE